MAAAEAAEPPLEGQGCFTTEEDFLAGLEELLRAYGAYTAVTGPAASRPRLQACVAVMDKLALSLETVGGWMDLYLFVSNSMVGVCLNVP